jgi:RNA polymerase sigma factor FliA
MVAAAPNQDKLVMAHLDLARKAAAMVYPRVKAHCEFDELEAMARVGLVDAAQRFNPSHGASFKTFAWYRAYGALMDGLRKQASLPRKAWTQLQTLRAASEYLEQQSQRGIQLTAEQESTALSLHKVQQSIDSIKTIYLTSLDANATDSSMDQTPLADEVLAQQQRDGAIAQAIDSLPAKERQLMMLHYYEGKSLTQAGQALGLSRSWASRLHTQAIDRLRKKAQQHRAIDDG